MGIDKNTIAERIRALRKEKNMTQLQLARLLNVTDKAVSKWESSEGNPDISLLSKLSEIFDVTIDYILIGKQEQDTISLDDMDTNKRLMLLIKKDDAENFVKYKYDKVTLITSYVSPQIRATRSNKYVKEEIYKNKSLKIFNLLLDLFLKVYTNSYRNKLSPAALIYDEYFDNFLVMTIMLNRVDVLDFINFDHFAIGDQAKQGKNSYPETNPLSTYQIKESTFEFAFSDPEIYKPVLDYLCNLKFFSETTQKNQPKYYFLNEDIILNLYKYKLFDRLDNLMKLMYQNVEYGIERYGNCTIRGSWYTKKRRDGNFYYLVNDYNSYTAHCVAVVEHIKKAMDLATKNLDMIWVNKFNAYNKYLSEKLSNSGLFLSDKDIDILEMKANPKESEYSVLAFEATSNKLLNIDVFLGKLMARCGDDTVLLKRLLSETSMIFDNFIKTNAINYCELIAKWVNNRQYKAIFEFAVDHGLEELSKAAIEGNNSHIIELASKYFFIDNSVRRNYINDYARKAMKLDVNLRSKYVQATSEEARDTLVFSQPQPELDLKVLMSINSSLVKGTSYSALLNTQSLLSANIMKFKESYDKTFFAVKKSKIDNFVSNLEEKIESLTNEKKSKQEHDRISAELNKDYFLSLIKEKHIEVAVIKLCVKLEAELKYRFKYEGDLIDMITNYVKDKIVVNNSYDDEGYHYYESKREDEHNQEVVRLLHKLRIVRNGLVHPNESSETMTIDELTKCIDIVFKI